MNISKDVEKAWDKIQHSFYNKTLSKVDVEGTYLNIIKAVCDKSIYDAMYDIIVNGKKA